jgi:hypothetical protein
MATVTPNYSWPVPTSSDYVKDGASAIEALGDAIDATVFANSAVIQVKNTVKTTAFTTTSASFVDVTGLSVSITPTSATNNILVFVTVSGIGADVASSGDTGFVIVRNSTQIGVNTDGVNSKLSGHLSKRNLGAGTAFSFNSAANVLDSPATTSAVTYKIQVRGVGGGTTNINRDVDGNGSVSTITVMEVKP